MGRLRPILFLDRKVKKQGYNNFNSRISKPFIITFCNHSSEKTYCPEYDQVFGVKF